MIIRSLIASLLLTSGYAGAGMPKKHIPGAEDENGYRGDFLEPGESLKPGQYLMSDNCECVLTLQEDGDLVIWQPKPHFDMFHMAWRSGTKSDNVDRFTFQENGDLVVLNDDDSIVWAASEHPNWKPAPFMNATLAILSGDCQFRSFGGDGGHQFWTTVGELDAGDFNSKGNWGMCAWFDKGDYAIHTVTCEIGPHDGGLKTVECPVAVDECQVMCDDCEDFSSDDWLATFKGYSYDWKYDDRLESPMRPKKEIKVRKRDDAGWTGNPYLTCATRAIMCHVGMSHNVNQQQVVCIRPVSRCVTYDECCGDEFEIETFGDNVIIRRTDNPDAGWWQDLQLMCELDLEYDEDVWMQEDTAYTCHVGPSEKAHKEVECNLPLVGSSCRAIGRDEGRKVYTDEFTFESNHRTVAVQRTDANTGWSWNLYISCNINKEIAMLEKFDTCKIGNSYENSVTVDCGFPVYDSCGLVDVCCGDKFALKFEGTKVTVRRTDNRFYGWGQFLVLECGMPKPTKRPSPMPTVFKPTEKGIESDFPTLLPTFVPSLCPTLMPSYSPTRLPTLTPSLHPTAYPEYYTMSPTYLPTMDNFSWLFGGIDVSTFKGFKEYCEGMSTNLNSCKYCDGRKLKKCSTIGCQKTKVRKGADTSACVAPKKSTKVKCKKIKDPVLCAVIGCNALEKRCTGKPAF